MYQIDFLDILRFIILPIIIYVFIEFYLKKEKLVNYKADNRHNYFLLLFTCLGFISILSTLKFLKLYSGNYEFFDAGLILNEFVFTKNLDFGEVVDYYLFHAHFRPLQILFNYIFKFFDNFYLILLIQTLILSSTIIPLFLILKKINFDNKISFFLIIFFIFNPIIGFVDILGFHIDTLVIPILVWGFYYYLINNKKKIIFLILLSLVSEVYILTAAFASLVFFENKKNKFLFFSLFMMFFLIIFYYFLANYSINSPSSVFGQNSAYALLKNFNLDNLILTFLSIKKIFFLYYFSLLFGFFFIKNLHFFIIAIPSISKILLSTEAYHYDVTGHYANDLFVICFMAMIFTLSNFKSNNLNLYKINLKLIITGFFSLIIAHSIYPFSINFWSNSSAGTYNYKQYKNFNLNNDQELKSYLIKIKQENFKHNICINNGPFVEYVYKNNISFINFNKDQTCDLIIINSQKDVFTSGSHSSQENFNNNFKRFLMDNISLSYKLVIQNNKYHVYKKKNRIVE